MRILKRIVSPRQLLSTIFSTAISLVQKGNIFERKLKVALIERVLLRNEAVLLSTHDQKKSIWCDYT